MSHPPILEDEELMLLLYEIKQVYGDINIDCLKKAHKDDPFKFPSYKTFERRFGGVKQIWSDEFKELMQDVIKTHNGGANE